MKEQFVREIEGVLNEWARRRGLLSPQQRFTMTLEEGSPMVETSEQAATLNLPLGKFLSKKRAEAVGAKPAMLTRIRVAFEWELHKHDATWGTARLRDFLRIVPDQPSLMMMPNFGQECLRIFVAMLEQAGLEQAEDYK